jgi:ABC-type lipoprotein export system ATPase subunit
MADTPVVVLEGVTKSFRIGGLVEERVEVLRDADLTIGAGEKVSLVGPSGSGKSTLLGLIAGLLQPDAGTITIDGEPLAGLDDGEQARLRADRIGFALQADNLIPFLTSRENVQLAMGFGAAGSRSDRSSSRRRADELLDRFGVAHRADHRPRTLSGGEAKRVALAVALANRPALLLADEVVAQLDGVTAGHVVDEVVAGDFALLLVTHDLALADRVPHRYRLARHRIEAR